MTFLIFPIVIKLHTFATDVHVLLIDTFNTNYHMYLASSLYITMVTLLQCSISIKDLGVNYTKR